MTAIYPNPPARPVPGGNAVWSVNAMMPISGSIVRTFPGPPPALRAAMEKLQCANIEPPLDEEALSRLALMERPWDPGSCTGQLRIELWPWLDEVAIWVNQQHLWNVAYPGIPECWPAHPHVAHDLAVLACSRYYTSFTKTPAALAEWHRNELPGFLGRLQHQLGDGCQPAKHQQAPRTDRDESHADTAQRCRRRQRYADDIQVAAEAADGTALHNHW